MGDTKRGRGQSTLGSVGVVAAARPPVVATVLDGLVRDGVVNRVFSMRNPVSGDAIASGVRDAVALFGGRPIGLLVVADNLHYGGERVVMGLTNPGVGGRVPQPDGTMVGMAAMGDLWAGVSPAQIRAHADRSIRAHDGVANVAMHHAARSPTAVVRMVAAHEVAHAVQLLTPGAVDAYTAALGRHGVVRADLARVSLYSLESPSEAFSETTAMVVGGLRARVPARVLAAWEDGRRYLQRHYQPSRRAVAWQGDDDSFAGVPGFDTSAG